MCLFSGSISSWLLWQRTVCADWMMRSMVYLARSLLNLSQMQRGSLVMLRLSGHAPVFFLCVCTSLSGRITGQEIRERRIVQMGGRGVKDEKKRRNKINAPGVKVKQSSLQCVPPLHTFSDNAEEYLMTSALLTHISINVS